MKAKLQKVRLGVTLSAAMLTASVIAAEGDLYLQDGFGGPVKDPFGRCVLTMGGRKFTECEPVAVAPAPAREQLTLGADAFFFFDRYDLKPSAMQRLDELAAKLNQLGPAVTGVSIVGNTDAIGTEEYNQALSERRARSVADYLAQRGVNPSIMTVRGDGKRNPVASNETAEGRAQNRRVDVTIDSLQQPPQG